MDAQYKMITKTAHLVSKECAQEEANEMFATMSGLKEQLTKVGKLFKAGRSVQVPYGPWHPYSSFGTLGKSFTC